MEEKANNWFKIVFYEYRTEKFSMSNNYLKALINRKENNP